MATSLGIVNPKKRREIDGVGSSSMVCLAASFSSFARESCMRVRFWRRACWHGGWWGTVTQSGCMQVDLKATLFRAEDQAKRVKASGMPAPKSKVARQAKIVHMLVDHGLFFISTELMHPRARLLYANKLAQQTACCKASAEQGCGGAQ